jgi:hypothetical protein
MKQKTSFALTGLVIAILTLCPRTYAADSDKDKLVPYKQLKTISIPDGLVGFDISWVDSESGRYYLADRGNATATPPVAPSIDVIDTKRDEVLYKIPLFSAPNGVLAIRRPGDDDEADQPGVLVVGTLDSHTLFIDLAHPFATPISVSTGGNHRADELAYDPADHVILIANDQDTPAPYITFISTVSHSVLGKIIYDGTAGNPKSTGGIEQPVWDGATKRFYISIPSTMAHADGEVDEIDPVAMKITRIFPTSHFVPTCGPAGLALIPGQHLMTSCGDVLAIGSGAVVHTVTGVAGDEIWYNPGDERVYFGGGTNRISVNVVNGLSPYNLITTVTVGVPAVVSPPAPAHTTHSVAADSELNRIFVPVSHEGVKVYSDDRDNGEGPDK